MVGRGRPPKAPEDKYQAWLVKLPPELLDRLRQLVPANERSALLRRLLQRELKRLERAKAKA